MHWDHLFHLLAKGVEFGINYYAERQSGRPHQLSSAHPPAFEHLVQSLTPQPGFRLLSIKPTRATFEVRHECILYLAVLVVDGAECSLGVFSNIAFPPGCVPAFVQSALADANHQLGRAAFAPLDVDDGTRIVIDGQGRTSELTRGTFADSLRELTVLIAGLDDTLVDHGYRRS